MSKPKPKNQKPLTGAALRLRRKDLQSSTSAVGHESDRNSDRASGDDAPKRKRARALPARNAFCYTLEDGQAMGLPGRTKIYELIADGQIATVNVGGRTMLVGDSVRRVLGVREDA